MPQPPNIYTLGYAQWTAEEVEEHVRALNAILVDIRHSPYTTKPGFTKEELKTRLDDHYVHVPAFGNVNYKDGPVELAQPERGIEIVGALSRPPVLMCGCQSPARCHRSTAADVLAERTGAPVTHLRSPGERAEPGLFSDR